MKLSARSSHPYRYVFRFFFYNKQLIGTLNSYICFFNETDKIFTAVICYEIDGVFFVCKNFIKEMSH